MLFIRNYLLLVSVSIFGVLGYEFPHKEENSAYCATNAVVKGDVLICNDTAELDRLSDAISAVVEKSKGALVYFRVKRKFTEEQRRRDLFEYFFGYPQRRKNPESFGSGFFVDLDKGYIVTNAHVVKDWAQITLTLANGNEYEGEVLGADEHTDIAVVKIKSANFETEELDFLELAKDTSDLRVGDVVIALGAPFGFKASVSMGIISGLQRGGLNVGLGDYIQTDTAINPGNSGGPLLDSAGKVIGVNSMIMSMSGGNDGLGFAIPAQIVRHVSKQLIESGAFARGYMGVTIQALEQRMREHFHLADDEHGVIISDISEGKPAANAGLKVGDVILSIDGEPVHTPAELVNAVGFKTPGSSIIVNFIRDGKRMNTKVTLGDFPTPNDRQTPRDGAKSSEILWGLSLEEINHGKSAGYLFVKDSTNLKSDVKAGDVIVAVDNIKVQGLDWFANYIGEKNSVILYVVRDRQFLFVTLHRD